MKNITSGEILSPAGNAEMLTAAIRCGADAVYLGLKDFSARRNAQNFSQEELREAVKYCHIRGVKVYLTLNILIKEAELETAFNLAQTAYNLGIDGIIVEDLGLAAILHEKIPELPLHASTQMSVHSESALPILKQLGFKQVVAAREMSYSELSAFCKKADELGIVVEAFIHGALCMSVSGQCLLSAFLGSRSGNRGLCAGPCRLPFSVKNGTGYDLSLKDLSLLQHIKKLYEIGVRSFKIEGRMMRPEYVAAATYAARLALDTGVVDEKINKTLQDVFSRQGFTDGYFTNTLGKNMFGIRTKEDVVAADKAFPLLHELYRKERQSVPVDLKLKIKKNEPISLTLECEGESVTAFGEIPKIAQNKPITYENALAFVSKLGNTPYYDEGGSVSLDDGLFVSAGELNELRRNACSKLDEKKAEIKHPLSFESYVNTKIASRNNKTPLIYARFEKLSQIPKDLSGIAAVIIPLEENIDNLKLKDIPLIVDIPRGISSETEIEKRLKTFKEKGFTTALCGNLSAVTIATREGFKIIADTGLNISNSESVSAVSHFGAEAVTISCEEEISGILKIPSEIKKGIVAYGNIPLMLFKNCPLKNGIGCNKCEKNGVITDRLGIDFPVRCRMGYSELLNSLPIWLADRLNELRGLDFITLYFTRETPERVEMVINSYKNGSAPDVKHTRGLYYRGTL